LLCGSSSLYPSRSLPLPHFCHSLTLTHTAVAVTTTVHTTSIYWIYINTFSPAYSSVCACVRLSIFTAFFSLCVYALRDVFVCDCACVCVRERTAFKANVYLKSLMVCWVLRPPTIKTAMHASSKTGALEFSGRVTICFKLRTVFGHFYTGFVFSHRDYDSLNPDSVIDTHVRVYRPVWPLNYRYIIPFLFFRIYQNVNRCVFKASGTHISMTFVAANGKA